MSAPTYDTVASGKREAARAGAERNVPSLAYLLAGLMGAAGAIHLAMVPMHGGGELIDPIGFAVAGWFQLAIAGIILAKRPSPSLYAVTAIGNTVLLGLWAASRTVGLPVGSHANIVEEVGAIDAVSACLQGAAILLSVVLLWAPDGLRLGPIPALVGLGVLGLATALIVSPEAAEHGGAGHSHGDSASSSMAGGGHDHGGGQASTISAAYDMSLIDDLRCDTQFNVQGYWDEAAYLGVDTYAGGAMSADHHAASSPSLAAEVASPSINGGRGSETLDRLAVVTDQAGEGEAAAGRLVAQLSEASDEDYRLWLQWLRDSGAVAGGHDHDTSAPDDNGGHGGHVGPQPWKAMVDESQCEQLEEELTLARETALSYPTAADATKAGWVRVTPYVPGIAAHYMNFSIVDGTFEIDQPEMILYDGNGPDAAVVGLSYYIIHEADSEPTQGFTGDNDHYHRHVGLCVGAGGVIGDTTLTEEECAAIGGRKQSGGAGWMSHAWVVPGCESPWGVFSAASPILEGDLVAASGTSEGCAASGVIDRYDMSPATDTGSALSGGDQIETAAEED